MTKLRFGPWQLLFLAAAIAILIGAPLHPGGSMEEMLVHPSWVPSHSLMLVGFAALLGGLLQYRRAVAPTRATARWLRLAIVSTALQTVEMAVHLASAVDGENLAAGLATPVLTVHMLLALVIYPIFGATLIGLIVAGARERTLGSWLMAPIGIVGLGAYGIAVPMMAAGAPDGFSVLFMGIAVFGAWLALAALGPAPAAAVAGAGR